MADSGIDIPLFENYAEGKGKYRLFSTDFEEPECEFEFLSKEVYWKFLRGNGQHGRARLEERITTKREPVFYN